MTNTLHGTAETWAANGEAERIAELGLGLAAERREVRERLRGLDRDLNHVLRVLALTPGRRFVDQLVRLWTGQRDLDLGPDPRLLASLLAEAQSPDDAARVLSADGDGRLAACLFHELVLRGADPEDLRRRAGGAFRIPEWNGLARLPGRLAEWERDAPFPSRSYRGGAGVAWAGIADPVPVDAAARRAGAAHPVQEATPAHLAESIGGPAEAGNWGAHEVRVFRTEQPVGPDAVTGVLAALPMDCLAGLGDNDRFVAAPSSPAEAWRILFASAAHGGLWGPGVHGAMGRLSAWRSVAGLCGAPQDAAAAEVEQQALACNWFRFEADTPWFADRIFDYGIAALTPDGRRLAVLAAVDVD
ncbi:DUF6183 family protein [Streptomyces morookaense]|uniref:Uncharacterized protein n=1 Tax=Streptomyces morookaense TaxID=1970 RepID=A0A7Y7B6F8_STRMO|nr:DUF6183 family protein [Streptomyces morookaense]NVK79421.1 hypothetical protein [Streptomyces morookaense]GHF03936.1 hypothetical protein GCM10010359_00870 [Streptomyces morookaense]